MAYNFKNALVRTPSKSISNAISSIGEKPNFEKVISEHNEYKMHLERSDINVITLDSLEDYPDSVFVEDPAITFNNFCIISSADLITCIPLPPPPAEAFIISGKPIRFINVLESFFIYSVISFHIITITKINNFYLNICRTIIIKT